MRCLAVLVVLFTASWACAELPPGSYNKLRADADEAIIIHVTDVKIALMGGDQSVTVEAKVLAVERSKNGLKKGDTITIVYTILGKPVVGPLPVPLLEKGEDYPAFLNKKGQIYEPAAYGWSFKMTLEVTK